MSRYNPTELSWGNTSAFVAELNQNFEDLIPILDDLLSRSGDTPNTMGADLDMNSNDVNNAGVIRCDMLLIDNAQIPSLTDIQEAFAEFEVELDDAVQQAETSLDATIDAAETSLNGTIAAADTTFNGYLDTASGYVDDSEAARDASVVAQGMAETAKNLAEDAQAAAELAEDNAEAWAAGVNLPAITGGTAGQFLRVNSAEDGYELNEFYQETTVDVSGSGAYTSGTLRMARVGNVVTISASSLIHTSFGVALSGIIIPTEYRPTSVTIVSTTAYVGASSNRQQVSIRSDGSFQLSYDAARTSPYAQFTISYVV